MYRITVVDDEPLIADGIAKIIRHIDPSCEKTSVFYDPEDALRSISADEIGPDLLITDIKMPKMTGLELVEKVRETAPDTMCAVLTSYSEFEYAKKAIEIGVVGYLLKPIETSELSNLLNKMKLHSEEVERRRKESVKAAMASAEGHGDDAAQTASVLSALSRETRFIIKEIGEKYRDFDISGIADRLQLSKDYLFRLFRKEMGMSAADYLLSVRMEKAKELLSNANALKIYEISELVGYEDYAYFSKLFKKAVGMTPKSFQKYSVDGEADFDDDE